MSGEPELHPMAEAVPIMIDAMGVEPAIRWWMKHAVDWPTEEGMTYSIEAIDAMANDDVDYIIKAVDDGEPLARAFQWVRMFGLEPFVEATKKRREAPWGKGLLTTQQVQDMPWEYLDEC